MEATPDGESGINIRVKVPAEIPALAVPIGLARLATLAYRGIDIAPLAQQMIDRVNADPTDAAALMDLSTILQLCGQAHEGLKCQTRALVLGQIYAQPAAAPNQNCLRLLMFAVPGDFMANTPVEFILDGSNVRLDTVYILPGRTIPERVPNHDIALVGIAESPESQPVLRDLARHLENWPKPVLNDPIRILDLSRERLFQILRAAPGIEIPVTARVERETLRQVGCEERSLQSVLSDASFPIIVRPVGSHAGNGLLKLEDASGIIRYLAEMPSEAFYMSRFVDYRSVDRLFRKYRIALIAGRPYLCHMAVAGHWMLHYLNAGMHEDVSKRAEEARAMITFDHDFAARHDANLSDLMDAVGLDYFAIDCAETSDGKLLVFEAGTAMIIHKMDPPEIFPYKHPQMEKVCSAFTSMLASRLATKD